MQNRSPAIKLWISDILNADYIPGDETEQAGIKIDNTTIPRVNILGVVINIITQGQQNNIQNIELEDGTGRINARLFNATKNKIQVGDCIFLIGRPKSYNNQKYINAEIAKVIENPTWIQVRDKEIPKRKHKKKEELHRENNNDDKNNNEHKILLLIKQKDTGEGADYDSIINESGIHNTDNILQNLIQKGEIFLITPSKIKVLE